jgi:hypothetical protein
MAELRDRASDWQRRHDAAAVSLRVRRTPTLRPGPPPHGAGSPEPSEEAAVIFVQTKAHQEPRPDFVQLVAHYAYGNALRRQADWRLEQ